MANALVGAFTGRGWIGGGAGVTEDPGFGEAADVSGLDEDLGCCSRCDPDQVGERRS